MNSSYRADTLKARLIAFISGRTSICRAFFLYFPLSFLVLSSLFLWLLPTPERMDAFIAGDEPVRQILLIVAGCVWMLVLGFITVGIISSAIRDLGTSEETIIHKVSSILIMAIYVFFWLFLIDTIFLDGFYQHPLF